METDMLKKKIYIVDDHPLVREWLSNLISQEPDLEICGTAESYAQALEGLAQTRPDLAVVDITLGEESGIELIREIKPAWPELAIIVLSMHNESLYAERAMRAGAKGYVMKKESTTRIIDAIRTVLEGKTYFSDNLDREAGSAMEQAVSQLSDRELEVFQLLGKGYETRRIGERLQISMNTVQVYCARIKDKLRLSNANELLREAVRWVETRAQS